MKNPLWDAFVEAFGYAPITKQERGLWGMLIRDLQHDGVTPDQVRLAARGYRKLFPSAAFTPTAVVKHFSASLAQMTAKPRAESVEEDTTTHVGPPPGWSLPRLGDLG